MKLTDDEAGDLILVTARQFEFWRQAVHRSTPIDELRAKALDPTSKGKGLDDWARPNYMYYWFILAHLRMQKDYRAPKREITGWKLTLGPGEQAPDGSLEIGSKRGFERPGVISGIGCNTCRRYVGQVETLGLADSIGRGDLILTKKGQQIVEDTLDLWHEQFGAIYKRYLGRRQVVTSPAPA